jgi:uncharacterized membrane protein YfcA
MTGAVVIGLAGGVIGGLMGLGGGVVFVPGLVIFLGLSQQQAEATSLLAIVPVAIAGALAHDRHGNVRRREGLLVGVLALAGAAGGVAVANTLSGTALRSACAAFLLVIAAQIVRRELRPGPARRAAQDAAGPAATAAGDRADGGETSPAGARR